MFINLLTFSGNYIIFFRGFSTRLNFDIIGDTQYLLNSYPEKMTEIYDWLVENKNEHKINYVMGLGDIVEHLYFENKGENG